MGGKARFKPLAVKAPKPVVQKTEFYASRSTPWGHCDDEVSVYKKPPNLLKKLDRWSGKERTVVGGQDSVTSFCDEGLEELGVDAMAELGDGERRRVEVTIKVHPPEKMRARRARSNQP